VKVDIAIVGSGMAGAAAACFAAPHARVVILEREPKPGLHSTGRSAAMLEESCGPSPVRALTRASRAFFEQPGAGFAEAPLLRPRGALFIAAADRLAPLRALHATLRGEGLAAQWLGTDEARARCPVLRPEAVAAAVLDPGVADIDVHALHQGCLKRGRAAGATLVCDAEVQRAERWAGGWRLHTPAGVVEAGLVGNAAGAWADELAAHAPGRHRAPAQAPIGPGLRPARGPGCARRAAGGGHRRELLRQARGRPSAGLAGQRRPGAAA
jgi:D-arginine dehydrogenase